MIYECPLCKKDWDTWEYFKNSGKGVPWLSSQKFPVCKECSEKMPREELLKRIS
jgi:hypothetical protein